MILDDAYLEFMVQARNEMSGDTDTRYDWPPHVVMLIAEIHNKNLKIAEQAREIVRLKTKLDAYKRRAR